MRKCAIVALLLLSVLSGCQCEGLPATRVGEINAQWYQVYTADRKPTAAEITEFNALDDAGKQAWKNGGKPFEGVLSDRLKKATDDLKTSIDAECEAAK
jgi:hypothetical protein